MNKRIDFTKLGGFPATQFTVNWMQDSYRNAFGAIAAMVGDRVIVTGVEVTGGQATNGWISYNGELLPFVGGAVMATFVVEEVKESRLFNDNESKEVYFTRRARFGSPGISFNSLTRFGTVAGLWQKGDTKDIIITHDEFVRDFDATGLGRNSRIGWAWVNGENGTPSAKGRVFVNYDPADANFDILGNTGGSKTKQIARSNLPPVSIDVPIPAKDTSQGTARTGGLVTGDGPPDAVGGPTLKTAQLGNGIGLDVLNPYFVALKIIKL